MGSFRSLDAYLRLELGTEKENLKMMVSGLEALKTPRKNKDKKTYIFIINKFFMFFKQYRKIHHGAYCMFFYYKPRLNCTVQLYGK